MSDMLVDLLKIPSAEPVVQELGKKGIRIVRAMTPNLYHVTSFVEKVTGLRAKGEATVCFSNKPVSCFIALKGDEIIGYACYDATMNNFFGPTEVLKEYQGLGIGKALLLRCLESMKANGYAYAIIGSAGPTHFYEKCCGAKVIEDTTPGIYKDMI